MATKIGVCLLIILTTVLTTNGFSTEKCDHHELSNQVGQFSSCLNSEFSNLVDQFLKYYKDQLSANISSYDFKKGCPALRTHSDNVKKCFMSLPSSCLREYVAFLTWMLFLASLVSSAKTSSKNPPTSFLRFLVYLKS